MVCLQAVFRTLTPAVLGCTVPAIRPTAAAAALGIYFSQPQPCTCSELHTEVVIVALLLVFTQRRVNGRTASDGAPELTLKMPPGPVLVAVVMMWLLVIDIDVSVAAADELSAEPLTLGLSSLSVQLYRLQQAYSHCCKQDVTL